MLYLGAQGHLIAVKCFSQENPGVIYHRAKSHSATVSQGLSYGEQRKKEKGMGMSYKYKTTGLVDLKDLHVINLV